MLPTPEVKPRSRTRRRPSGRAVTSETPRPASVRYVFRAPSRKRHARLRTRLAGVVAFALAAGAAVSAVLTFGTGTLDGAFWVTSPGLALGMAALAIPFLGSGPCSATPGSAPGPR